MGTAAVPIPVSISLHRAGACQAAGVTAGDSAAEHVTRLLAGHFADHSQRLARALRTANERAWKALEIALAGESFWNWLDRPEDRALRRQLRAYLAGNSVAV